MLLLMCIDGGNSVKKALSFLLVLSMVLGVGCMAVSAETASEDVIDLQEGIYYFEDGSYIVTERVSSDIQPLSVGTKVNANRSTYYNSNDVAQCALEVTGTFEVNYGISVKCTDVSATSYVYVDGWTVEKVTKSSSTGAGPTAYATASGEFVQKVLFITTKRVPVSVTVTCDKNGN